MSRGAGRGDGPRRGARRSLGQHFLVDPNVQRRIVDLLRLRPGDTVLEVGPGRGALTRHLVDLPARLILVELDDALARELTEAYAERPGVEILHRDILELGLEELVPDPSSLLVVGNIPYNITTPILFHLLRRPRPREALLMVQREVADRIVASAGTSQYGALAVGVRTVAAATKELSVPRSVFRPVPAVDSAVVRVTPFRPPPLSEAEEEALRELTRAAFQWRRKQFQKILRDHPEFGLSHEDLAALEDRTGFDLTRRPETFGPEAFVELSRALRGAFRTPP